METKGRKDSSTDFLQLLRESSAKTGVQGVSNIGGARSRTRKAFWAVVVVTGFGMLTVLAVKIQVLQIIINFLLVHF